MVLSAASMRGNAIAGFTSIQGRSHTFDTRADGYARGEAIVACACRLADNTSSLVDVLMVLMMGSAIRQDGRSASLTAPNGQAQQGVLCASFADARASFERIATVEAHGTGTPLGDPIEGSALGNVLLSQRRQSCHPLALGSLKANAGHTEPGAGLAGTFKLMVQLVGGDLPSNAQLRTLNKHIGVSLCSQAGGCCLPVRQGGRTGEVSVQPHDGGNVGGVSSFGYAGTIAHAVLRCVREGLDPWRATPPVQYRRRRFPWRVDLHPFAQHSITSPDAAVSLQSPLAGALCALVADYVVQGRVIFPGAGYLEMVCAAGAPALGNVFFLQPMAVDDASVYVDCTISDGRFEVRSCVGDAVEDATLHCTGATAATTMEHGDWQLIEHASLRVQARPVDVDALYDMFSSVGLQYGPGYRTLTHAWGSRSGASSRLRARSTLHGTRVHPADLDDALCTGSTMAFGAGSETRLPFAVDAAVLRGAASELWAVRSTDARACCLCLD